jgi:adenylate cyclase class IV
VIRKIYDWTVYFDSTLTNFSQHSEARIFRFYKNKEDKVVMMYKTNILENNWRGFQTELSSKL